MYRYALYQQHESMHKYKPASSAKEAQQLTLPMPEDSGCSGDACGAPLRERLRGLPGPTAGGAWSG